MVKRKNTLTPDKASKKEDELLSNLTPSLESDTLKDGQMYLGNKNLPKADAEFEYTPERISEIKKCSNDIKYFAENYFYIVTLDNGKQKISLYDAQKKVLKSLQDNRFVITTASRQVGKCFDKSTIIKIRNKKTGIIENIKIIDLYNRLKNN